MDSTTAIFKCSKNIASEPVDNNLIAYRYRMLPHPNDANFVEEKKCNISA